MRIIVAAFLLSAPLFSAPAAAEEASFRVGTAEFAVEIPSGYCLPTGELAEASRRAAAAESSNVTHLRLVACGPLPPGGARDAALDYILIKTPRSMLDVEIGREQLLARVGAQFEDPAFKEALRTGKFAEEAGKHVSQALGHRVDLTGTVRPLGKDLDCAYIGGTMSVQSAIGSYTVATGACMTSVEGRVISVYWYGPDTSSEGIGRLVVKAGDLARAIRKR